MTISVVLPVYNGELYLKEAISSILNQTYSDFELIIINDGSTDNSLNIIHSFDDNRIVLIDQSNQGLAKSLNNGLRKAKGKFIARMDADDIALPQRFEKQIQYLEKRTDVKLLGTAIDMIDKDGNVIATDVPYIGNSFLKKFLQKIGNPFKHPTVIFDREIALNVGGYNEDIGKYFEDYFLWNEIAHHGKIEILNEVLLKYRVTPGSIMSSVKSNDFSKFMITVINKRSFNEQDKIEMNRIKSIDNKELNLVDKEAIYNKRISGAVNNKMNKLFIILENLIGKSFALSILTFIKKIRIVTKIYL
ncbi:glycosyltransferase [Empedobacter brevis]|uniref:glycosyltransferase n=1 Tax=Empedobacter brevis TaxID=247 RepID=UPI002FE253CC